MSNLVDHARTELARLGNGEEFDNKVIEMIETFSNMGHSGSSAVYTVGLLERLLNYKNLTPLTNDPEEWYMHSEEVSGREGGLWQNRRNGEAFSHDGGRTYYLLSEGANEKRPYPLHDTIDPDQRSEESYF